MDHLPPSARVTEPIPARLPRGTVLGRHAIDGWLREGGMAALYRAHHVATGARVAIKVQRTSDEDDATVAARFVREGEVMGRLSGVPNVVQVHDMGELPDGRRYLVMEWIEGDNLEERLDGLRNADTMLPIDEACRLLGDVARALDAAHRASIVHRDVKPSNIMIEHGLADREVAKLLDFGISADLGAGGRGMDLTAAGVALGTSGYAAPEQVLGLPAHPAFDVYALGVVSFEALTGRAMPPEGLGPIRLPRVGELRKRVPAELEELVARCMSRDPSRRPGSAGEVAEVLESVRAQWASARVAAAVVGSGESTAGGRVEPSAVGGVAASGESTVGGRVERPTTERSTAGGVAERSTADGVAEQSMVGEAAEQSMVAGVVPRLRWPWLVGMLVIAGALAWRGWVSSHGGTGAAERMVRSADVAGEGRGDDEKASRGLAMTGDGTGAPGPDLAYDSPPTAGTTGPDMGDESVSTVGASASAGTGAIDSGGSSDSASSRSHCRRARDQAQATLKRRDWPGVIRTSADRACWSSLEQRLDRQAMRVKAWLELRRYDRCVTEGKGQTDPRVARLTKHCREMLTEGGS
jgi:tRNA A-37 threonylcarbamoyl transferase component Bud32